MKTNATSALKTTEEVAAIRKAAAELGIKKMTDLEKIADRKKTEKARAKALASGQRVITPAIANGDQVDAPADGASKSALNLPAVKRELPLTISEVIERYPTIGLFRAAYSLYAAAGYAAEHKVLKKALQSINRAKATVDFSTAKRAWLNADAFGAREWAAAKDTHERVCEQYGIRLPDTAAEAIAKYYPIIDAAGHAMRPMWLIGLDADGAEYAVQVYRPARIDDGGMLAVLKSVIRSIATNAERFCCCQSAKKRTLVYEDQVYQAAEIKAVTVKENNKIVTTKYIAGTEVDVSKIAKVTDETLSAYGARMRSAL